MSPLIDPGLFKDEGGDSGDRPFANPYGLTKPRETGFKDPRPLTRIMVGVVGLDILVNALFFIGLSAELAAPTLANNSDVIADGIITLSSVVTIVGLVRLVVMLFWFYRACKNARTASSGLEITPGWAVGFFFVPIMSLFKPYQAISEIWRSATEPLSWRSQDDPTIIRWWWGLYLASAFAPLASRLAEGEGAGPVYLASLLLGFAENIVFILIVRYVARRQWENKDESVFD